MANWQWVQGDKSILDKLENTWQEQEQEQERECTSGEMNQNGGGGRFVSVPLTTGHLTSSVLLIQ